MIYKDKFVTITHKSIKNQHVLFFDILNMKVFPYYFLRILEFRDWKDYNKNQEHMDLNEYIKWFYIIHKSDLDYCKLFFGMFIPNDLIRLFYKHYKTVTTMHEEKIFEMLTELKILVKGKFKQKINFVIVNRELCELDGNNVAKTFEHEFSHLLFEIDEEYAELVRKNYILMPEIYKEELSGKYNLADCVENIDYFADEWGAEINRIGYDENSKFINIASRNRIKKLTDYFAKEFEPFKEIIK